ncbi:MAG: hypothetical protein IJQ44_01335 [Bacteroidaceae bacterium]|nr:hypothetical protein [Bacteroidaceae bacterium]
MKKIKLLLAAVAAMFAMGANAQTAADFANGKYVFQNIGSGRYLGPGNSWGTQASLIQFSHYNTLAKLSDGVYSIESQVSNGGTNYYFTGSFMDGAAVNVTITDLGGGIYTMSNGSTYYGYDGSSYVLASNLTDASNVNAQWKIIAYDEAYNGATAENPVDVTYMILDANFDRNNRNGGGSNNDLGNKWTMNASNQNLCGGDNTNMIAESWRSAFTLSQNITVPNGYYKLRAQAALTEYTVTGANFPIVYITSGTTTVSTPFKTMQNGEASMSAMSAQFTNGNYFTDYTEEIIVTNGAITVGVKGTRTDTWCTWDNFQLQYLGPITDLSAYEEGLEEAVAAAQAYQSQLPAAVYANIASAITEYNKEYDTADEYTAAIEAINNAVSTYATSAIINAYSRYNTIKTAALAIAENTDTDGADADLAVATTNDAIVAAIVALRAAFLAELPNVEIPQDPGYIDVTAVMVDNAGVRQNTDFWTAVENGSARTSGSWAVCNYNECEFYNNNFKFYQTLALSRGTWEFGVTGFHRAGNHSTYFYAGEDKILIPGVESSVVNTMAAAETYFNEGNGKVALKFVIESAQDVEIGINNQDTETDKWTIFRDFTLKYYGAPDYSVYAQQWNDAVTAANAAKADAANTNVTGSELTAVNEAIGDAPDGSSKANYLEKIQALQAATQTFTAAAPSYNKYVAYRAETVGAWGEELAATVDAPTTAAEAISAVQALNIAQYNKVASDYTYSATGLIGDFGSWTGTATYGTGKTPSTPNYLSNEHWSGQTHAYYEQCSQGWGDAGGWTIQYEKTCILPAGDYVIKVAARSSGTGVTSLVSCSETDVTVTLPAESAYARGIKLNGAAGWDGENSEYARDGVGYGWAWRFLPFSLTEEKEVTMTFYAEATTQYQWMSIADGELLSTTKLAQDVAYDEKDNNTITNTIIADVTMTRSIKEGYNSVVLPFTLTANQVTAAFGSGSEVYNFSENSTDANDVTVNFTKGDGSITANTPVLVKATAASTEQVFNGVQIVAPTTDVKVAGTNVDFMGVYGPTDVIAGDYFVADNKLYKSNGNTNIKAFRAYIDATEESSVKFFIGGQAFDYETAVNGIEAAPAQNSAIYNIAGQRVSKAQKGIFIVNGKKVVK